MTEIADEILHWCSEIEVRPSSGSILDEIQKLAKELKELHSQSTNSETVAFDKSLMKSEQLDQMLEHETRHEALSGLEGE